MGAPIDLQRCLSCDTPLTGRFCSSCGQRHRGERITLGSILGEVLQETLSLGGRVPRTLLPFLFVPGALTSEYLRGRRVHYTSPFRLYLATSLFCLFALWLSPKLYPPAEAPSPTTGQISLDAGSRDTDAGAWLGPVVDRWNALDPQQKRDQLRRGFREYLPTLCFVLLPLFALLLHVAYLGRGLHYAEHVVFALHLHAFWFLLESIHVLVAGIPNFLLLGVGVGYGLLAARRVYEASWPGTLLRGLIVGTAYGFVALMGLAALVLAAVAGV